MGSPSTRPMREITSLLFLIISLATLVLSKPFPQPHSAGTSPFSKELLRRVTCPLSSQSMCIGNNYCCPYGYLCAIPNADRSKIACCTELYYCTYWTNPIAVVQGFTTTASRAAPTTTRSTTSSYYSSTTSYRPSTTSYSYSYSTSSYSSSRTTSYSSYSYPYSYSSSTSRSTSSSSTSPENTSPPNALQITEQKKGLSDSDKIALGVGIPSAIGAIVTVYACVKGHCRRPR